MIVVDASAVVDFLIDSPTGRQVKRALELADALVGPDLLIVEVTSAVWRLVRSGVLPDGDAAVALSDLDALPLEFVPARGLLSGAWALRHRARIADAFYVALAQQLRAPLLTTDQRLIRSNPGVPILPLT